jgi:hypothetical protein
MTNWVRLNSWHQYEYFVCRQQCNGNPFLRFHGKTQRFYIVGSYLHVINDTKGSHCCVSMRTTIRWSRHNVTLHYAILFISPMVYNIISCAYITQKSSTNLIFVSLNNIFLYYQEVSGYVAKQILWKPNEDISSW